MSWAWIKLCRAPANAIIIINMNADNPPRTWISYEGIQTAAGFKEERDEINLQYPNTESCKSAVDGYIKTVQEYCDKITGLRKQGAAIPRELAERAPAFPQPYFNQWPKNLSEIAAKLGARAPEGDR